VFVAAIRARERREQERREEEERERKRQEEERQEQERRLRERVEAQQRERDRQLQGEKCSMRETHKFRLLQNNMNAIGWPNWRQRPKSAEPNGHWKSKDNANGWSWRGGRRSSRT
jgi:hypothetical protein